MISHPHQIFTTGILLVVFSITAGLPARGQVPVRRNGQDRRVGGIILPTPPFIPDSDSRHACFIAFAGLAALYVCAACPVAGSACQL